jgi:O-antigen ligase
MLFVIGAPFVYCCGLYIKNWVIRYGLWLIIPLAWHAIFLTSSRGALLGVAVTLAIVTVRSRRVGVGLLILSLFAGAYYWQAGSQMKVRATGISTYEEDRSASSRLEAWEAAITMTLLQPISGVGVAAFIPAFSSHSNYQKRATHNTFLEIYAESGIFAGTAWLLIVASIVTACLRTSRLTRRAAIEDDDARFLSLLSEAMLAAILGFFTCATFLSVKGYEIFFLLGLIAHVMERCSRAYVPDKKIDVVRPGYGRQMPLSVPHERARAGGPSR